MKIVVNLVFLGLLLGLNSVVLADSPAQINTYGEGGGLFSDPPLTGVAIKGYDTVAYFKQSKPVKGSDSFVTDWRGAKWKFASQKNLAAFKENPEKFAPQFGGYCAYGVAQGSTVKIEPDQWSVVDGKLYLNYDADVSKKWKKDQAKYIIDANKKFPDLIKK